MRCPCRTQSGRTWWIQIMSHDAMMPGSTFVMFLVLWPDCDINYNYYSNTKSCQRVINAAPLAIQWIQQIEWMQRDSTKPTGIQSVRWVFKWVPTNPMGPMDAMKNAAMQNYEITNNKQWFFIEHVWLLHSCLPELTIDDEFDDVVWVTLVTCTPRISAWTAVKHWERHSNSWRHDVLGLSLHFSVS